MTLEKVGIYAGIIGLAFTVIWSVFTYIVPSMNGPDDDIFGIWLYDYGYSSGGGTLEINGTTEYFNNNSYNFIGLMNLTIPKKDQKIKVSYNVDLSGEWKEVGARLVTKVIDIKSHLVQVTLNSMEVDLSTFPSDIKRDFPKVEDFIPIGTSEKYKILNLSKEIIELEAITPKGKPLIIVGTKQNKRFQRG